MNRTKKSALERPGRAELVQGLGRHKSTARVRGAWGTKALVNERFSPGVKSEKWIKDTCVLLLSNDVGQWEGKFSHDGELLQALQSLASDLAHFWQAPFPTWFGCRQRSHQEQRLDTSAPFSCKGVRSSQNWPLHTWRRSKLLSSEEPQDTMECQLKIKQAHVCYFKSLGICTTRKVSSESAWKQSAVISAPAENEGLSQPNAHSFRISNPFFKAQMDWVFGAENVQVSHISPLWNDFTCGKNLGRGEGVKEGMQGWKGWSHTEMLQLPREAKSVLLSCHCHCLTWEFRLTQRAFETRVVQEIVTFLGQVDLAH